MTTEKGERSRRANWLELVGAILCLVAALTFAFTVVSKRLARRTDTADRWLDGEVLTPSAEEDGVVVIPGSGHLLIVDSTPGGAEVVLRGEVRGVTPLSQDLSCAVEERVSLELRLRGYQPAKFELACLEGSTRVNAALTRKGSKPAR